MSLSAREHQLLQALVVLAILYLAIQVFGFGWVAVAQIADVIIIFVAAWVLAYLLSPLVNRMDAETPLNRTLSVVFVFLASDRRRSAVAVDAGTSAAGSGSGRL